MTRLAPILALSIGLGLSAPALAASQGDEQMEGSQAQSQQQQSQSNDPHRMMVIGEVVDVRGVQLKGPAGDKHRLLKLSAKDAKEDTIIVDLGAMTQQAFEDLGINQGNLVWALGSSARINGKPVIYARYVGELKHAQEQGEFSSFEANDPATDDYGAYDEDFAWETEETDLVGYDQWYGEAASVWGGYYQDIWVAHPGEVAR